MASSKLSLIPVIRKPVTNSLCIHLVATFTGRDGAEAGARFTATTDATNGGWQMRYPVYKS